MGSCSRSSLQNSALTFALCLVSSRHSIVFGVESKLWAAPGFVDTLLRAMMLNEVRTFRLAHDATASVSPGAAGPHGPPVRRQAKRATNVLN